MYNRTMLTQHRRSQILSMLKRDGQVIAKDVSLSLGLSEDTIRRDLREMASEGLLQRVHGGALPASPAVADFAGRELLGAAGKVRVRKGSSGDDPPGPGSHPGRRHYGAADCPSSAERIARHDRDGTAPRLLWNWCIIQTRK